MQAVKILFIITLFAVAFLHVGSSALKKKTAEILTYVNLGLHIAMIFELLALKVSFEFMALVFMLSLLIYLSSSLLFYKIRKGRIEKNDL